MFILTNRETGLRLDIKPLSKIELTFSEDWISVNISVWSREHGVSINSEWLTMKIGALPKNDLNQIGELVIEETPDSEVIFSGPFAGAFRTGDDMGFYYYVNQSLFPDESRSILTPAKKNLFRFRHESQLDQYAFSMDLEIPLTTLTAKAWHEEPEPKKRIEDLKLFFARHFDASLFSEPEVTETENCFLLTYQGL